MTQEDYIEIKDMFLDHVKGFMNNTGGMQPHITVFAKHRLEEGNDMSEKDSIIHIPIPAEYFNSEDKKDEFMEDVMPEISKKIKSKFVAQAVCWASEAWMRVASSKHKLLNYKKIPVKKEVLIVTLESEAHNDCILFEIIRKGKKVNEDGDMVDDVDLIEMEDLSTTMPNGKLSGRFSGLYDMVKI